MPGSRDMHRRRLTFVALALLAVLLPAGVAHAFAGRNGVVAYAWSELQEPDLGPSSTVKAIRVVSPSGGTPRTIIGCKDPVPGGIRGPIAITPLPPCSPQVFADPAFSADGTRIAFDNGRELAIVDAGGGHLRMLPAPGEDDAEPAFSAAGGRLAFSAGPSASGANAAARGIWVRDLARGTARRIVARGTDPVWSSRNWIAFERTGQLWMVRPDGRGLRRLTRHGGTAPAWSPHGTKLAFARRGSIYVLELRSGRLRRAARGAGAVDLAWSPDGRRFALTTFDGTLWTMRTDGRDPRVLVAGGVGGTYNLSASGPDWQPLR